MVFPLPWPFGAEKTVEQELRGYLRKLLGEKRKAKSSWQDHEALGRIALFIARGSQLDGTMRVGLRQYPLFDVFLKLSPNIAELVIDAGCRPTLSGLRWMAQEAHRFEIDRINSDFHAQDDNCLLGFPYEKPAHACVDMDPLCDAWYQAFTEPTKDYPRPRSIIGCLSQAMPSISGKLSAWRSEMGIASNPIFILPVGPDAMDHALHATARGLDYHTNDRLDYKEQAHRISFLLKKGANPNACFGSWHRSATDEAIILTNMETTGLLIQSGGLVTMEAIKTFTLEKSEDSSDIFGVEDPVLSFQDKGIETWFYRLIADHFPADQDWNISLSSWLTLTSSGDTLNLQTLLKPHLDGIDALRQAAQLQANTPQAMSGKRAKERL